jgi:hypothetical protein
MKYPEGFRTRSAAFWLGLILASSSHAGRYETADLDPSATAVTAADLLLAVPGFQRTLNANGVMHIGASGLPSRYLQVLINGEALPGDASLSSTLLERISAARVQAIVVDREGDASRESGGGGSASVNLILPDTQDNNHLLLQAGTPHNVHNLTINANDSQHWKAGFSQHTENRADERASSGRNLNMDLAWTPWISTGTRFESRLLDYRQELQQEDNPLGQDIAAQALDSAGQQNHQNNRLRSWQNHLQYDIDSRLLTLSGTISNSERHQDWADGYHEQNIRQYQIGISLAETRNEHRWSTGVQYQNERLQETALASASKQLQLSTRENHYQAFVQDNWQVTMSTRIRIALRMESYDIDQYQAPGLSRARVASATWWLPAVSINHRINAHNSISLSGSQQVHIVPTSLRIPYTYESGGSIWYGNNSILDEVINNHNLTWKRQFNTGVSAAEEGIEVRLLQRNIHNARQWTIDQSDTDSGIHTSNNESGQTLRGLEAGFRSPFRLDNEQLHVSLDTGFYRSTGFRTEPAFNLSMGLEHTIRPRTRYGLNVQAASSSQNRVIVNNDPVTVQRAADISSSLYLRQDLDNGWHISARTSFNRHGAVSDDNGDRLSATHQVRWLISLGGVL